MYNKGKKILAWLLMAVMLCSGNSVSVFAQEMSQNDTELVQSMEETDDSCVESDDINIESETEANEDAEADIENIHFSIPHIQKKSVIFLMAEQKRMCLQ